MSNVNTCWCSEIYAVISLSPMGPWVTSTLTLQVLYMVHVYQPPNHALYQGSNEETKWGANNKKTSH